MQRDIRFVPVEFVAIEETAKRHRAGLSGPIDSYVEAHILASAHYRIELAGELAGFASINQERLITQFALDEPCRSAGQRAYWELRHLARAQSAFVPTGDQFFLSHALDDYRRLTVQAFLFAAANDRPPASSDGYELRLANESGIALVQQQTGDFFDRIHERIAAREVFVTMRHGKPVGFGLMEPSAFVDAVASVGMFTFKRHRRTDVRTATIALLIAECHRRGVRPVAGCWFYNHASKRTLERAGMHAPA